jgi:hypothetical protein
VTPARRHDVGRVVRLCLQWPSSQWSGAHSFVPLGEAMPPPNPELVVRAGTLRNGSSIAVLLQSANYGDERARNCKLSQFQRTGNFVPVDRSESLALGCLARKFGDNDAAGSLSRKRSESEQGQRCDTHFAEVLVR